MATQILDDFGQRETLQLRNDDLLKGIIEEMGEHGSQLLQPDLVHVSSRDEGVQEGIELLRMSR